MTLFLKSLYLFAGLLLTVLLPAQQSPADYYRSRAMHIKAMAEKYHYRPKPVDDAFSEALWNDILQEIDPYALYLKPADIKELERFKYLLDDELKGGNWQYLPALTQKWRQAVTESRKEIKQQLAKPPNYQQGGYFDISEKRAAITLPADESGWKKRWQQYLHYRMLDALWDAWQARKADDKDTSNPPGPGSAWMIAEEPKLRDSLQKSFEQRFSQWADDTVYFQSYVGNLYLNAVATLYDPHTNYFDPSDREDFKSSLSTESLIFGFTLGNNDAGEVIIDALLPGSAAWYAGNIFKGDVLREILLPNGKTVVVKDISRADLSKLLGSIKREFVTFTFQSADGKDKKVKLRKEAVENEENIVRGFVLEGSRRIGYIALPAFYTEWDDNEGSSCAADLAKEILKLKREKIEGLIFDLRYNGGGSLQEAVDIAGIFIEAGPMAIVKERQGKSQTLKDPSRGMIYDGPLAVMVNGQSASASELVAATLQDYNRAIIVGSPTFGKATMQTVYPLDSTFTPPQPGSPRRPASSKTQDYIKITQGALYRISGSSNQMHGVIPDIVLPDAFESSGYAEKKLPHALQPDTIMKTVFYNPLPAPWKQHMGAVGRQIRSDAYFQSMASWNEKKAAEKKLIESIPLQWQAFQKWNRPDNPPEPGAEAFAGPEKINKVLNSTFTESLLAVENDYKKERNTELRESIMSDIYIHAAFTALLRIINP